MLNLKSNFAASTGVMYDVDVAAAFAEVGTAPRNKWSSKPSNTSGVSAPGLDEPG